MTARSLRGVVAALCVALALSVQPAAATQSSVGGSGISLEPVGFPSFFTFETPAGSTLYGSVRVRIIDGQPHTVMLRPSDVKTAQTGGLDYGLHGARPRGNGRLVRLGRKQVRLGAGGVIDIPFTMRVPKGSRSGDHLAGILAFERPEGSTGKNGRFQLKFVSRIAIPIVVKVPGPRRTELKVKGADVNVIPSGAFLGLKLHNAGNTLISKLPGRVTVLQDGRRLFSSEFQIDSFVPETAIEFPVAWKGRPVEGDYQVRGQLGPEGPKRIEIDRKVSFAGDRIEEYKEETGKLATRSRSTSPLVMSALVVALIGLLAMGVAYMRLRRRA